MGRRKVGNERDSDREQTNIEIYCKKEISCHTTAKTTTTKATKCPVFIGTFIYVPHNKNIMTKKDLLNLN